MNSQYCYDHVPRGAELRYLLSYILQLIAELESAMTSLPHVAKDGSSECHFARELYVKKEKLEQEVAFWIQELHRFLAYLRKEVERCLRNLERIRSDARRLNLEETRQCYSEAATEQEREYQRAVEDRDAVYIVLKKAEAVLEVQDEAR